MGGLIWLLIGVLMGFYFCLIWLVPRSDERDKTRWFAERAGYFFAVSEAWRERCEEDAPWIVYEMDKFPEEPR